MTAIYDPSDGSSNQDTYFIEVSSYAEVGDIDLNVNAENLSSMEEEEDFKDFPEHPSRGKKRKRKPRTKSEDSCTEDSGMLSMLAEVASATLDNDHSVNKPNARGSSKNKPRGSTDPKKNQLTLTQIQNLSEKQLIDLFARSDSDEIRRTFSFKCFLLPRCVFESRSFASEAKARQEMQKHLSSHIQDLVKKSREVPGFKFNAVPVANIQKKVQSPRETRSPPKSKVLKVKLQKASQRGKQPKRQQISRPTEDFPKRSRLPSTSGTNDWDLQSNDESKELWEKMYDTEGLQLDNVVAEEVVVESEHIEEEADLNILPDHDYNIYATSKKPGGNGGNLGGGSDEQMRAIAQSVAAAAQEKLRPSTVKEKKDPVPINRFMLEETTSQGQIAGPKTKVSEALPCVGSEVVVGYNPNEFYIMKSADLPVIEDLRQKTIQQTQVAKDPLAIDLEDLVGEVQAEVYIEDEDQLLEAVAAQAREPEEEKEKDYYMLAKRRAKIQPKFVTHSAAERELALQYINEIKQHRGSGAGLLECKICVPARSFTAPTTLLSHYRSHAGIKPYECRRCGAVFTRQHSLNYHMLIHANMSRFTCPDCNRQFRHPSHYKEHRRRHTGEAPYECSDCMQRFRTRNSYKRHLMTRHGKLLTSDGALIILPEEEFKKVRCKPRARKRSGNLPTFVRDEEAAPQANEEQVTTTKKRRKANLEDVAGSSFEQQRQEDLIRLLYQRLTSSSEVKDEENASLESSRSCSPIPGMLTEEEVAVENSDVAAAVVVETMPGPDEQVIEGECEVPEESWDPSFINLTVDGQNNVIFLDDNCQDATVVVEPDTLEVDPEVPGSSKGLERTDSPAEIDLLSFVHNAGVMVQHILDIQPNAD